MDVISHHNEHPNEHTTDDVLTHAFAHVRRRNLGVWRDEPVWIENSGAGGARRLVRWSDNAVRPLSDDEPPIGSALYDYGAPAWCALDEDTLVVILRGVPRVRFLTSQGAWSFDQLLGPGKTAGYPTRVSASEFAVVVDHGEGAGRTLQLVSSSGSRRVLHATANFISDLDITTSGDQWCWLEWTSATMPFDDAFVMTATLRNGIFSTARVDANATAAQPRWHDGHLWADLERGEWFRPHFYDGQTWVDVGLPEMDFRPDWTFGFRWRCATVNGQLISAVHHSRAHCVAITPEGVHVVDGGPQYVYDVVSWGPGAIALGSTSEMSNTLISYDAERRHWTHLEHPTYVAASARLEWRRTSTNVPYVLCATTDHGDVPGLVVFIHSGPAAYASFEFSWLRELFCSNGFSVASVDYRGSTSYGATYRRALFGRWGDADVADVLSVIDELVTTKHVRGDRVFVRGSSAGGLTALVAGRDPRVSGVVAVSAVTRLDDIVASSGELERCYTTDLVGDHSSSGRRSPAANVSSLNARTLLIHGEHDDVVPCASSRELAIELERAGKSVELLVLAGDGHSIVNHDNLRRSYAAELAFYMR